MDRVELLLEPVRLREQKLRLRPRSRDVARVLVGTAPGSEPGPEHRDRGGEEQKKDARIFEQLVGGRGDGFVDAAGGGLEGEVHGDGDHTRKEDDGLDHGIVEPVSPALCDEVLEVADLGLEAVLPVVTRQAPCELEIGGSADSGFRHPQHLFALRRLIGVSHRADAPILDLEGPVPVGRRRHGRSPEARLDHHLEGGASKPLGHVAPVEPAVATLEEISGDDAHRRDEHEHDFDPRGRPAEVGEELDDDGHHLRKGPAGCRNGLQRPDGELDDSQQERKRSRHHADQREPPVPAPEPVRLRVGLLVRVAESR